MNIPEYELENLLDYDGRKLLIVSGHFLKFEFKIVSKSERVPHGLSYSLTLHDPKGKRLVGFDNAHPVDHQGSAFVAAPKVSDHWHRTAKDTGRPYKFESTWKLMGDFFDEVEKTLAELGINFDGVVDTKDDK